MPPRIVWVVTDQSVHYQPMMAFVRQLSGEDVVVKHLYVEKRFILPEHIRELVTRLKSKEATADQPVIVFRDAENRNQDTLDRQIKSMRTLVEALRPHYRHCYGLAFNPCSEGAFLLFDEALHKAAEVLNSPRLIDNATQLIRERRAGRWISKDQVDSLFQLDKQKSALNAAVAQALFQEGLPTCEHAPYTRVRDEIRALLDAAWPPATP